MMRAIGIDLEKLKYPNNGLYTFCNQLGQRLPALVNGEEELLYYLPTGFKGFDDACIRPVNYKWYHRYSFNTPQIDVWHSVHQGVNVFPRKQARKIVLTIHDLNFLYDERRGSKQVKDLLKQVKEKADLADIVVAISQFTLGTLQEHLQLPGHKCRVVYQGSEIREYPGFDAPAYRPAAPFLFGIGILMPKKNFHVLPALLRNNDYELVIAGQQQGDYIKKIQDEAAALGVSDRLKLLGPVTDAEKYWYYKHCLAFTFPSVAEGFGAPVVEAMHFGKPVFLSDRTSLPEIGGNAAYYFRSFDPDAMQQVLEEGLADYAQRQPAAAIRRNAARFSWETNAKEYLKIYRELYN